MEVSTRKAQDYDGAVTVQPSQTETVEPAEGIDWSKVDWDRYLTDSKPIPPGPESD